ncbi:hypothetical protein [Rubritalea tangerina]
MCAEPAIIFIRSEAQHVQQSYYSQSLTSLKMRISSRYHHSGP